MAMLIAPYLNLYELPKVSALIGFFLRYIDSKSLPKILDMEPLFFLDKQTICVPAFSLVEIWTQIINFIVM